jgi:hypothetical protein
MNKRITLKGILLVSIFGIASCTKFKQTSDDLSGNNYIAGTATIINSYSTNGVVQPFANGEVYIRYTNSLPIPNFLSSVLTDSSGGFIFQNLKDKIPYTIYAYDSTNGIIFFDSSGNLALADDQHPIDNATLQLDLAQAGQNGVVYAVTDSLNNLVDSCNVWMFTIPSFAGDFGENGSAIGSNFTTQSNGFGLASEFNIPAVSYTVIFYDSLYPGVILTGHDQLQMPAAGIVRKTVQLVTK